MSRRALPVLFINLGGEMMYIIDQRIKAQGIDAHKGVKVMNDIISTMFNKKFIEELFKDQELYSRGALRTMFEKLAHASIMRLNSVSMDKLFDLMVMVLKYQMYRCSGPFDVIAVTLNHLDAIKGYVAGSETMSQVDGVYNMFIDTYAGMDQAELQDIRYTLLNCLQDFKIRVSMLLKDGSQNHNGQLVIPCGGILPEGVELPGTVRYFGNAGEEVYINTFPPGGDYELCVHSPSLKLGEPHGTTLGCNIYEKDDDEPGKLVSRRPSDVTTEAPEDQNVLAPPDPMAAKGLELLCQTIGARKQKQSQYQFRLNLFNMDDEREPVQAPEPEDTATDVIHIDGKSSSRMVELDRIASEMSTLEPSRMDPESEDLLDLLPDV